MLVEGEIKIIYDRMIRERLRQVGVDVSVAGHRVGASVEVYYGLDLENKLAPQTVTADSFISRHIVETVVQQFIASGVILELAIAPGGRDVFSIVPGNMTSYLPTNDVSIVYGGRNSNTLYRLNDPLYI